MPNPYFQAKKPEPTDKDRLRQERDKAMIERVMGDYSGRRFVRSVLKLLRYNEKSLENSANAYRMAALQAVAIDLNDMLYHQCPDQWEKMIREGVEEDV